MSIRLNVIDRHEKKSTLEVEEGTTIRDAIEEKLSPDNYGDRGAHCSPATSHAYVASHDFEKLKVIEEDEMTVLKEEAIKPDKHSRLGCQVELKKEYDNITVTIASD